MSKNNNIQELLSFINALKGFMDHEEGMCLNKYASKSSEYGPILEIGSYCGKSTVYMGLGIKGKNSCIYSIDHHMGSEENQVGWEYHDAELFDKETGKINSFPEFMRNLRKADLLDTVIPIRSEEHTSELQSQD